MLIGNPMKTLLILLLLCSPVFAQSPPPDSLIVSKDVAVADRQRQDDLREASEKFLLNKIADLTKLNELRAQKADEEVALRADYASALALAEAKRIDAIRAVDVSAVAVASQRASDQAAVLATQVAQSAEALRGLVATTATAVAASQQQLASTLSARLTTLEQAGYAATGRQTLADPAFIALQSDVRALVASQESTRGTITGRSDVIGWIVGGIGLLIALGSVVLPMFRNRNLAATDPAVLTLLNKLVNQKA